MNRAERRAALIRAKRRKSWDWIRRHITESERMQYPAISRIHEAFLNDVYSVQIYRVETDWGTVDHLAIRDQQGNGGEPLWRDMQRIKNELIGHDRTAIQVYPSDEELVDQADLYHLWVLPEGIRLPFGLHRSENGFGKACGTVKPSKSE